MTSPSYVQKHSLPGLKKGQLFSLPVSRFFSRRWSHQWVGPKLNNPKAKQFNCVKMVIFQTNHFPFAKDFGSSNHPTETSINKLLFRAPGVFYIISYIVYQSYFSIGFWWFNPYWQCFLKLTALFPQLTCWNQHRIMHNVGILAHLLRMDSWNLNGPMRLVSVIGHPKHQLRIWRLMPWDSLWGIWNHFF